MRLQRFRQAISDLTYRDHDKHGCWRMFDIGGYVFGILIKPVCPYCDDMDTCACCNNAREVSWLRLFSFNLYHLLLRVLQDIQEQFTRAKNLRKWWRKKRRQWALESMPYQEYLQTSEWKERAKAAKKQAGWRCEVCNARGPLEVHHLTYAHRGNERPGELLVVCRSCHAKLHGRLE